MSLQQQVKEAVNQFVDAHSKLERLVIIREFVAQVNKLAEKNIERTGRLEGAHYAAMTKLLGDLEREAEANKVYTYPEILERFFPDSEQEKPQVGAEVSR